MEWERRQPSGAVAINYVSLLHHEPCFTWASWTNVNECINLLAEAEFTGHRFCSSTSFYGFINNVTIIPPRPPPLGKILQPVSLPSEVSQVCRASKLCTLLALVLLLISLASKLPSRSGISGVFMKRASTIPILRDYLAIVYRWNFDLADYMPVIDRADTVF